MIKPQISGPDNNAIQIPTTVPKYVGESTKGESNVVCFRNIDTASNTKSEIRKCGPLINPELANLSSFMSFCEEHFLNELEIA